VKNFEVHTQYPQRKVKG